MHYIILKDRATSYAHKDTINVITKNNSKQSIKVRHIRLQVNLKMKQNDSFSHQITHEKHKIIDSGKIMYKHLAPITKLLSM